MFCLSPLTRNFCRPVVNTISSTRSSKFIYKTLLSKNVFFCFDYLIVLLSSHRLIIDSKLLVELLTTRKQSNNSDSLHVLISLGIAVSRDYLSIQPENSSELTCHEILKHGQKLYSDKQKSNMLLEFTKKYILLPRGSLHTTTNSPNIGELERISAKIRPPSIQRLTYYSLAKYYTSQGKFKQANLFYKKALKISLVHSWNIAKEYALFLHYDVKSSDEQAIKKAYDNALKCMKTFIHERIVRYKAYPNCLLNMGTWYASKNHFTLALKYTYQALKMYLGIPQLFGRTIYIRLLLVKYLTYVGSLKIADKIMKHIFIALSDHTELSNQFIERGDQGVVTRDDVFAQYAVLLARRGRFPHVELCLSSILNVQPHLKCIIQAFDTYASKLMNLGEMEQSISIYDNILKIPGVDNALTIEIWLNRAFSLEGTPRIAEAMIAFEHAIRLSKETDNKNFTIDIIQRYALYLRNQGKVHQAFEFYEQGHVLDPMNPHLLVQMAWCGHLVGLTTSKVEKIFAEAISCLPTTDTSTIASQYDTCYVLGEYAVYVQETLQQSEKAAKIYEKALSSMNSSSSANYPQVAANFAVLLGTTLNQKEKADVIFNCVIEVQPPHQGAWFLYLDYLIKANDLEKSLQTIELMLVYFPHEKSNILVRQAKLYELQNPIDFDKIMISYLSAIKMSCENWTEDMSFEQVVHNSTNIIALAEYASILNYKLNRHEEAAICYKALRVRIPEDFNVAVHYGRLLYEHLKDFDGAVRQFTDVLHSEPGNIFALDFFAEYYVSRNDDDAAEDCHLQCIRTFNRLESAAITPNPFYQYATFLMYHVKHIEAAGKYFRTALEVNDKDSFALAGYATYLLSTISQDEDGSITSRNNRPLLDEIDTLYTRSLTIDPLHVTHLKRYAVFLFQFRSEFQKAIQHVQKALQIEPENTELHKLSAILRFFQEYRSSSDCSNQEGNQISAEDVELLISTLIQADPCNISVLTLYANYLIVVKKDTSAAARVQRLIWEISHGKDHD